MSVADRVEKVLKEQMALKPTSGPFASHQFLLDLAMLVAQSRERDELHIKQEWEGRMKMDINSVIRKAEALLVNTKPGEAIEMNTLLERVGPSFGVITSGMEPLIKKYVKDRKVFDLMGGEGFLSVRLQELGARESIVIDYKLNTRFLKSEGLRYYKATMDALKFKDQDAEVNGARGEDDVAFCSWIPNHQVKGLLRVLSPFKTVIYLGKNTDGTACAWPDFFRQMRRRRILNYHNDRKNTLIVYGADDGNGNRKQLHEEIAGIDYSIIRPFTED